MPPVLVNFEKSTLEAMDRIALKRKRAEFIRQAVKAAIRSHEYARMREAYRKQPDSPDEADDWSNAEAWDD